MIAALQSSLSAKDMELEVHMKCILLKLYVAIFTSRVSEHLPESMFTVGTHSLCKRYLQGNLNYHYINCMIPFTCTCTCPLCS